MNYAGKVMWGDSGTVVEKLVSNQKVASSIPCRSVIEQDTSFLSSVFFPLFFPSSTLLSFVYSSFQNCEEYTFPPGFAIFGGIRIAACSYICCLFLCVNGK